MAVFSRTPGVFAVWTQIFDDRGYFSGRYDIDVRVYGHSDVDVVSFMFHLDRHLPQLRFISFEATQKEQQSAALFWILVKMIWLVFHSLVFLLLSSNFI
jgi:hypothetical protein